MKEKGEIRAVMRQRRKAILPAARAVASATICEKLLSIVHLHHSPSPIIAVYIASPDEIDLTLFIERCFSLGIRLVAPRWNGTDYELAELNGCWPDKLIKGPHGILEPTKDAPRVETSEVGVWIVPGLAFTKDGARLGYGGGWYDRLMSEEKVKVKGEGDEKVKVKGEGEQRNFYPSSVHLFSSPSPYLIGVGYRFQVVDALPTEPHDVVLDEIVTD